MLNDNNEQNNQDKESAQRAQKYIDLDIQLKQLQCHPILIFGTASSGKSAFLQSMIHYGSQEAEKGFLLTSGQKIYPPDYDNSKKLHADSVIFYEEHAIKWRNEGRYPNHTQRDQFFISVDLEPGDRELPKQLFAFLEGNGELLHPNTDLIADGESQFPELTELCLDLIQNHDGPLSLLFFAPFEIKQDSKALVNRETSCLCLANAMRRYFDNRPQEFQYRDNLCLLITKWDIACREYYGKNNEAQVTFKNIANVCYEDVLEQITKWGEVWDNFSNKPNFRGDRCLMPYSSGVNIDGRIELHHIQQPDFDYHNRTMWNWLYGNATAIYNRIAPPIRKILCPDTQHIKPYRFSPLEDHSIRLIADKLFEQER